MRDIKFRFWDGKQMLDDHEGWMEGIGINYALECSASYGYKIMQFTGLKDKNNKDIYEGDIIKYPASGGLDKIVQVVWNNDWLRFEGSGGFGFSNAYNLEIIGNIYENPELLNKQNHQ